MRLAITGTHAPRRIWTSGLLFNHPSNYDPLDVAMLRKVFRTGNRLVIPLFKDALELLGLSEGSDASLVPDREKRQMVISPPVQPLAVDGLNEAFFHAVAEFIDRYRPALEALAKL